MSETVIPTHIGYILDGNRRWAKKHGLPSYEGHLAGHNAFKDVVLATFAAGVKYVTAYGFSTENWQRSEEEVTKIMGLILKVLTTDLPLFEENNIQLKILGSRKGVSDRIIKAIDDAELKTANNTSGVLAICFNYGGQLEIVDAVKKIVQSDVSADDVNLELINNNIYSPEIPPLDMVVRTSGEYRISNFMLWRIAYSELMFIDKQWPEMTEKDVTNIINEYNKRSRRIGK